MFTPPQAPGAGGPSFSPLPSHPRRRGLPARSSLSNSFSFIPSTPPQYCPAGDDSYGEEILPEGDSSFFAMSGPNRNRMNHQGHRSMAQVSPRVRPSASRQNDSLVIAGGPRARSRLGEPSPDREREMVERERERRLSPRKRSQREDEDMEGERVGAGGFEEMTWGMIDSMRLWRHDAIMQHLYETAAFWGDKILSWTGDPNDAFWLAQTHFLTGHYLRAERLLTEPLPSLPKRPLPRRENSDHTETNGGGRKGKGKGRMEEDELLYVNGHGHGHGHDEELSVVTRGKLVDESLACRYLAAQCMVQQENHHGALALLGESNPFREAGSSEAKSASPDDGIKLHSSICHLRGLLHLRLSSLALAKECFVEALVLDVKNYEPFRELIEGGMMTSQEEWEFVQNLGYRNYLTEEQSHFVKLIYTMKLKKDTHGQEITRARAELIRSYGLGDNCDVLAGQADELYLAYKWEDCYAITSRILSRIPGHPTALPLHLACMHHIHRLRSSLFMLAHDLVEQDPAAATTWYAVGLWYFSGKRWTEARRYFSKANLIDSRFAPAWIAFAHSFAYEGEHDHAITAYSTSARLFQGSHLPLLFIGMEHLQLSSTNLAEEYFKAAEVINGSDPLLLNELGVVAYNKEEYGEAIKYFRRAIGAAKEMQGVASIWAVTHCNLGHAYRVTSNLDGAHISYTQSISLDPSNPTSHSSLAMIAQLRGDVRAAIRGYHTALSLGPQDPMATVLLEMALKEQIERLDPTTIPGLPGALGRRDLDPFAVPKGNPSFGPLPIETEPISLDEAGAEEYGNTPALALGLEGRSVDELGGERSMRRRGRISVSGGNHPGTAVGREEHNEENVGEGSTMDIEED